MMQQRGAVRREDDGRREQLPRGVPPIARVWHRAQRRGACWEYMGSRNDRGYGLLQIWDWPTRKQRHLYAHRVNYEAAHGPIPEGLQVCHRCDNPPCIRPDHLFLGTAKDNSHDAKRKGRLSRDHGRPGATNASAKLSEAQVIEIRRAYAAGEANQSDLARRFGVKPSTVSMVVLRKNWRHLP